MSALLSSEAQPDLERRFGGVTRLYGADAAERITAAHVVVVGVGGVGSWAAEALARSGVGHLTLIDLDQVAESNINRQSQALGSTLGMAKVRALALRIADINPQCVVHEVEEFASPENVADLLPATAQTILDCCDQARTKAAIAAHAQRAGVPVVLAGAAGGKRHPQQVQVLDLSEVRHDPLLAKVRYRLRRAFGAPRSGTMHLPCVCSAEAVRSSLQVSCDIAQAHQGLNCAGYGSSVMVTATFGMVAASLALDASIHADRPTRKHPHRDAIPADAHE
ncbi:MAG: tRNA threonylcarbamoyladenosine dehydratase [Proteobacteria bacterium]|nr:tRNA threonylcarbamoyladenosine dehydratase [Pseudomonadota bacterium]